MKYFKTWVKITVSYDRCSLRQNQFYSVHAWLARLALLSVWLPAARSAHGTSHGLSTKVRLYQLNYCFKHGSCSIPVYHRWIQQWGRGIRNANW